MSEYEFDLEVSSYLEVMEIMRGNKKQGPTSNLFEVAKDFKPWVGPVKRPTPPIVKGLNADA